MNAEGLGAGRPRSLRAPCLKAQLSLSSRTTAKRNDELQYAASLLFAFCTQVDDNMLCEKRKKLNSRPTRLHRRAQSLKRTSGSQTPQSSMPASCIPEGASFSQVIAMFRGHDNMDIQVLHWDAEFPPHKTRGL